MMLDFASLVQQCASGVHSATLQAVVRTESNFNPFAIGVVGGHLLRQPRSRVEAVSTARALAAQGIDFSMGFSQINKANLVRYDLTYESAFDPCENLRVGSAILQECYERAVLVIGEGANALRAAISCYYSGNFTRGLRADAHGTSYVQRVVANASSSTDSTSTVPAIPVVMERTSYPRGRTGHEADLMPSVKDIGSSRGNRSELHPGWDAFGDYQCDGGSCE
jgi:type IV secretion system protein VirB1